MTIAQLARLDDILPKLIEQRRKAREIGERFDAALMAHNVAEIERQRVLLNEAYKDIHALETAIIAA